MDYTFTCKGCGKKDKHYRPMKWCSKCSAEGRPWRAGENADGTRA